MTTWKIIILLNISTILASVAIINKKGLSVAHCIIIVLAVANIVISALGIISRKKDTQSKQTKNQPKFPKDTIINP